MLNILVYTVPFLLIISIIVTFHEYGHYSVARLFNTRIERFSVGFGKILFRVRDKRGVEWCLSALPLGGYVKFAGDENIASMAPSVEELEAARASITEREGADAVKDYFHFKPIWQRFLIILAGPVFNFILAIGVFAVIFMAIGQQIGQPSVVSVVPGSRGATAGFQPGDIIKSVDGHSVDTGRDVVMLVMLRSDSTFPVQVERNHRPVVLMATPQRVTVDTGDKSQAVKGGRLGITLTDQIEVRRLDPGSALVAAVGETWKTLDTNLTYISRIFVGKENGDQISGILGMTKATGDLTTKVMQAKEPPAIKALDLGLTLMQLIAFISIGVGFLNLLPVPALDGGHLAFYIYQTIAGKPVSPAVQNVAFRIAVVLILGLMLYAAWNDINHIGLVSVFGKLFS